MDQKKRPILSELPKITLILGGAASGKSAFAEQLVVQTAKERLYIATSQVFDDEMREKVDAHITARGAGWITIEAPQNLMEPLAAIQSDQIALLDCATMWLSNQMLANADLARETGALLADLAAIEGQIVIVTNEVGMGIVPDTSLGRRFRDGQGKLNQQLAEVADLVVFVAAGLPLVLKGRLP